MYIKKKKIKGNENIMPLPISPKAFANTDTFRISTVRYLPKKHPRHVNSSDVKWTIELCSLYPHQSFPE